MAGTLSHITLAHRALDAAPISSTVESMVRGFMDDFRLGAVLVDLPYYDRLWLTGLRTMAGLDVSYAPWGALVHVRSPRGLAIALLDRGAAPAGQALGLGFLTHMAVDQLFHGALKPWVMERADGSMSLDEEHKRIEDQMDLHLHYHLLGHPGLGTPYAGRTLALRPDPSWVGRVVDGIRSIHGCSPKPEQLRAWLRYLRVFGVLSSSSKAPWVKAFPRDNPTLQEKTIQLAEQAIALSARYLAAGAAYLEGSLDLDGFQAAVPDCSLLDGGVAEQGRGGLGFIHGPRGVSPGEPC